MSIPKKVVLVLGVLIVLAVYLIFFISDFNLGPPCLFDGMSKGYYVDKQLFAASFPDINTQGFFVNATYDTEQAIMTFAQEKALAYETNGCATSTFTIRNPADKRTTREEMYAFITSKTGCATCALLIGRVQGQLVVQPTR